MVRELPGGWLIILESLYHRRGSILSLLGYILTLDPDIPSPYEMLLSKTTIYRLKGCLHCPAIPCNFASDQGTHSQEKQCDNELILTELTDVTMFLVFLKCCFDRTEEWTFKHSYSAS